MKFAKTIRFDKSDLNVFENASEDAEWAISGAFEFSNDLNENLTGKRKQSFANGFLGLDTFGRSTLVSIVSIDESNKLRSSTGLAASWLSPLGPMTFILSTNLSKANTDETESFNFNLGTTF